MNGPSGAAGALLRGRGWTLERVPGGFIVRLSDGREACALSIEGAEGGGRALTPASRLRARPVPGALAAPEDREALEELVAALAAWLETRPRADAEPGAALAETHGDPDGGGLLLRTTFACNQRCPFCFVPLTGRPAPLPSVERALDALARRAGPRAELTLSGGEPASDPRLPEIVAAARRRGFRRFVLQTNAAHLARPGLIERLAGLGVRSYLVSLHAPRPALYDCVTGSRGQFPRAAAGLRRLLRAPGLDVTVNVVVNAANVGELPRIPGLVARLRGARARGRRPSFYFSMLNEAGHQSAPDWAVDLREAAPFLRGAVAACRRAGFPVARSGGESSFPACQFDEPARHASRVPAAQERVRREPVFLAGEPAVGRAKAASCRACAHDARCPGVPAAYARRFGLDALDPRRGRA